MAHSANKISQINVKGTLYDIHDKEAIHSGDLLEQLVSVMIFKGSVATYSDLPSLSSGSVKVGHVYLVTDEGNEYVAVGDSEEGTPTSWEELGTPLAANHTHSIAHTHGGTATVTGTNAASNVTVTGTNAASTVTGSVSIDVPTVSASDVYAKVSTGNGDFVTGVTPTTKYLSTQSITPTNGSATVISEVTPTKADLPTTSVIPAKANGKAIATVDAPTGSVTGVQSTTTTASKATAGTAVAVATTDTAKTVVTGLDDSVKASVSGEVLTLEVAVADTTSITPAKSNGTITPYTFTNVTVPIKATSASTFVTGVSTTETDVATVGTAVTVATGGNVVTDVTTKTASVAKVGTALTVVTGLTTTANTNAVVSAVSAPTGKALTSASLAAGTSSNGIKTGEDVTIGSTTKTANLANGSAAAQTWTQKTGTAAAQTWTQKTGTISTTSQSASTSGQPN